MNWTLEWKFTIKGHYNKKWSNFIFLLYTNVKISKLKMILYKWVCVCMCIYIDIYSYTYAYIYIYNAPTSALLMSAIEGNDYRRIKMN